MSCSEVVIAVSAVLGGGPGGRGGVSAPLPLLPPRPAAAPAAVAGGLTDPTHGSTNVLALAAMLWGEPAVDDGTELWLEKAKRWSGRPAAAAAVLLGEAWQSEAWLGQTLCRNEGKEVTCWCCSRKLLPYCCSC